MGKSLCCTRSTQSYSHNAVLDFNLKTISAKSKTSPLSHPTLLYCLLRLKRCTILPVREQPLCSLRGLLRFTFSPSHTPSILHTHALKALRAPLSKHCPRRVHALSKHHSGRDKDSHLAPPAAQQIDHTERFQLFQGKDLQEQQFRER